MKRILALILMIGLILSFFNIGVFASGINSEQGFFNYLDSIGTRKSNSGNKVASYSTYKEYNLIVYGDPWGDIKSTGINGKAGPQRRFLGYTLGNEPYTNPYFPPDETSGNKPENFNYIKPSAAGESWRNVHVDIVDHMINSPMSGNGATSQSFTLASIGGKEYGKHLSDSTWKSQGSIYLQHKGTSGRIWYITQTTPPMVGETIVTGEISTPSNTYYIKKDEMQVTIPTTVTAKAVLSGRAKLTHINEIKATSIGQSKADLGVSTVSKTSDFVATRANYKPGTHTVTLNGSVSLKSIFNDTGSSNVSKTITLIVEEEGEDPYVTTTVTPDPKEKKFESQDINVTLTINGDLKNYTKTSNIKEWVFYARQKEDNKALEKKVYTKTLNASTDYKFKIPASKVIGDNFTQSYVVRARVYFNEKVNGKDYYDAPAETFVYVYRNDPPVEEIPPTLTPPIAIIDAPKTVMAGEEIMVSGGPSRSTIEGGYITQWDFHVPNAKGNGLDDEQKFSYIFEYVWYPIEAMGFNNIYLTVEDTSGLRASTQQHILVTEPIPTANISIKGTLKENRKIVIDGYKSYSPKYYPLNVSKSKFTITNLDTGKIENVYYSGTLEGILHKEFLIKKAGKYQIELYVENTAGYSDTSVQVIEVKPDYPPIAEYSMVTRAYRDINYGNYATIKINDMSYSPDADFIQEWIWKVTYNSNNNKDSAGYSRFDDDASFTFKNSDIKIHEEKTISHGGINYKIKRTSLDTIEIKTNQVGYYLVELEVKEGFGQDTILQFITDADYRRGNTSNKHILEKTMKVDNIEPFVDFEP